MTKEQEHLLDLYLRGELSDADQQSLMQQMDADEAAREEFNFQNDVAEGLKAYRKAQLKARLDAIDVAAVSTSGGFGSNVWTYIAGVSIATVIGAAVFLYADKSTDTIAKNSPSKLEISIEDSGFKKKAPVLVMPEVSEKLSPEASILETSDASTGGEKKNKKKAPKTVDKSEIVNEMSTEFDKEIVVPSFEDVSDEGVAMVVEVATEDKFSDVSESEKVKTSAWDFETEVKKSKRQAYSYFDGKLTLQGDFDAAPYDLLEINTKKSRVLYLFYNSEYYKLAETRNLSDLTVIKDQKVIAELERLRSN